MNKELKMDLNAHNEYLTRKLAHYNEWLMDNKREFGKPYPGFPEDLKRKGKKMQSNVIADMTEVLSGTKAAPAASKAKAKPKAAKKSDGPRAGSKGDMALAIYKRLNGDKTAVISAIQSEIGMSAAGATTYFYNAKKLA
jgi:hypothetical protein